ncbi:hypothetical protein [Paenibacillus sp. YAF4_2]|uniref:hypothetical protein n=1 Tax=Paenibacillus sp. YAF4_2 TaxID=3233085 RepID=UPI003F94E821
MLGTMDESLRGHWPAVVDRVVTDGRHKLCRSVLELLADAGLQLEPALSRQLIAGLAVGGDFWSGLLAVQQGGLVAGRQRWEQLPDDYPGKGEYLAALAWVDGGRASPPPAARLAHALARVRAWPAWLAAGALAIAAADTAAAAEHFAAAREAAAQPWALRAAASGLAAAFAARARRAAPQAALAAPLLCEQELMLRVTSALHGL